MRWQNVGRAVDHYLVRLIEPEPAHGPVWEAACGVWYAASRFTSGRGRICQGCKRGKAARARADRREANLPIIRAMHAQESANALDA